MKLKRNYKSTPPHQCIGGGGKAANAILEYAVTLAIVSAVFVGMNVYLKRGMQSKLKDMADYFISNEQLVELDPSSSSQSRQTDTNAVRKRFKGGGMRLETLSTDNIVQEGEVTTEEEIEPPGGTSVPGGHTAPQPYTNNPSAGLPGYSAGGQ